MNRPVFPLAFAFLLMVAGVAYSAEPIRVATFAVDATPPIGAPMAYDPVKEVVMPLSCRSVAVT